MHCSDGWDRTPQLTCLAMLMMDAHTRTLRGFMTLIQKEWCDFGHKFEHRGGMGTPEHSDERSPVFQLFLDCVWQMMRQFPTAFEFDERLLLCVLDQLHAGRFGTFFNNCHLERARRRVNERTAPLWWWIDAQSERFLNARYDPVTDPEAIIMPSTLPKNLHFFEAWFLRFDASIVPPRTPQTFY